VRLKSFLEMRGADGGPWSRICALPAFWVGLLYDKARSMRRGIWSRTGASRGQTPAESLLERYQGAWGGDLTRVYAEESF
jgi:gamma-glutamylcysteine synthetase